MIKLFFSETKLNLTKTTHGKQYYFKNPFFLHYDKHSYLMNHNFTFSTLLKPKARSYLEFGPRVCLTTSI